MEKSASLSSLAKGLISFQSSVGKIRKEANNPFFKSKYASLANILDVIQEPLAAAGLCFSQFPDGDEALTTILMHGESGEFVQATYSMHATKKDPQGIGSAITYARRYALGAVLGLNIDDDDDGNAASQTPKQNPRQQANAASQDAQAPQPTLASMTKKLKEVSSLEAIAQLYYANAGFIEGQPELKTQFSKRKSEIENALS